MGQALYRKYRSKSLSEIVGQEHITNTLDKAITAGRISHAYLFTGPRGVGKTSIARIMAHEINKLPYTDEQAHMDIIEIDAASNRRIDEIRELRDKVYIAPTSAKYKVYIIDEVHMLTREAFNALLKTLEEPPEHVVFILATTDTHKLPETIVSRTQRFTFKPVEKEKVIAHLRHIAKQEKINVSDEALGLLAEHGEGSFRDSISLLDQARNHADSVGADEIRELLGIPSQESITKLAKSIVDKDGQTALTTLLGLYEQGYQAAGIAKQLAQVVRTNLTTGSLQLDKHNALELLGKLIEVPASHDPERLLEIVVLESSLTSATAPPLQVITAESSPAPAPKPTKSVPPPASVKAKDLEASVPEPTSSTEALAEPTKKPSSSKKQSGLVDDANWAAVLEALKKKHNTLYGIVRMAQPSFDTAGKVELGFAFAFHQKRIMDAKNRQVLSDVIEQVTGQNVEIVCVLNKDLLTQSPKLPKPPEQNTADLSDITTISNIFGGGELLES